MELNKEYKEIENKNKKLMILKELKQMRKLNKYIPVKLLKLVSRCF